MIKLKRIISEKKYYGLSISELLDKFLNFEGKQLIFFDTETLGLNAKKPYEQITQLGIIVIDGSTMKDIKRINLKVELIPEAKEMLRKTSVSRMDWEKTHTKPTDKKPEELLKMTGYFSKLPLHKATEEKALQLLSHVINSSKNPILVAHNAVFDMKFISVRGQRYAIHFKNAPVLDTMRISQLFFIPAIEALNDTKLVKKLKKFKLIRMQDIDTEKHSHIRKEPDTEFEEYTDPATGQQYLKVYYGQPSSSLGQLGPALLGKLDNWHNALSDVENLITIFSKVIEFFKEHVNTDIKKQQTKAIHKIDWRLKHKKNDKT